MNNPLSSCCQAPTACLRVCDVYQGKIDCIIEQPTSWELDFERKFFAGGLSEYFIIDSSISFKATEKIIDFIRQLLLSETEKARAMERISVVEDLKVWINENGYNQFLYFGDEYREGRDNFRNSLLSYLKEKNK